MMLVPGSVVVSTGNAAGGSVETRSNAAGAADSRSEGEAAAAEQVFALLLTGALATATPVDGGRGVELAGAAGGKALPPQGNGLPPGLPGGHEPILEPIGRAAAGLRDPGLALMVADAGHGRSSLAGDPVATLSDQIQLTQPPATGRGTTPVAAMAGQPPLTPSQPNFDQQLGQRLMMMVQHGVRQASVSVHPEHLGPIEIRLKLDGDGTQLTLHSPHAAVRDALEQALPRLRDMFGDAGLALADVDIGDGDSGAAFGDSSEADRSAASSDAGEADTDEVSSRRSGIRIGLLDTFA